MSCENGTCNTEEKCPIAGVILLLVLLGGVGFLGTDTAKDIFVPEKKIESK